MQENTVLKTDTCSEAGICNDKKLLTGNGKTKERRGVNLKKSTVNLAIIALLTASLVVISLFCTIKTEAINITLTFIPIVIAARLYGALGAGIVAGLGDILGWICHPIGALFPPITITAIVSGIIFGLFLRNNSLKGNKDIVRMLLSIIITQLIISTFVTPLWLNMLYGSPYMTFFVSRLVQIAVMTAIQLIVIPVILKTVTAIKPEKATY